MITLDDDTIQTLKVQFIALGLITITLNPDGVCWSLSAGGRAKLFELRTVKRSEVKVPRIGVRRSGASGEGTGTATSDATEDGRRDG
jgi:hypothetical protein